MHVFTSMTYSFIEQFIPMFVNAGNTRNLQKIYVPSYRNCFGTLHGHSVLHMACNVCILFFYVYVMYAG